VGSALFPRSPVRSRLKFLVLGTHTQFLSSG
jgi:hypothetical protein